MQLPKLAQIEINILKTLTERREKLKECDEENKKMCDIFSQQTKKRKFTNVEFKEKRNLRIKLQENKKETMTEACQTKETGDNTPDHTGLDMAITEKLCSRNSE